MYLTGISLQNFRNYQQQSFLFPRATTVIVGDNGVGKTSLLEAISLLATGESFRAERVEEMIRFGTEIARVKGKVLEEEGHFTELEITLTRGVLNGQKVQSRLYAVNNVRRLKKNFIGHLFAVVFRPEDMRLIEGSPGRRRDFIDTLLSVTDRDYAQSLKTYGDGLVRRNRLLTQIRENEMPRSALTYWTTLLLKHGQVLQEKRRQLLGFFASVEFPFQFSAAYQPSVISEARLAQYAENEVAAGHTLVGPHKDDFMVNLASDSEGLALHLFGSRGQQRLGVLWLKMCELAYLKNQTGLQPLLLLDDILSELDQAHRQAVLSLLNHGQAVITTTEMRMVEEISAVAQEFEILHI